MNKKLREIGLALNASHNTVTTDIPGLHNPDDDQHWRIDNSKEISMLNAIEEDISNGICPLCGHCNIRHENGRF